MDSSRKAEIYTDRDRDPAPHISGSGSPVEGQGESSGGQDSQVEGSDAVIGSEGDEGSEESRGMEIERRARQPTLAVEGRDRDIDLEIGRSRSSRRPTLAEEGRDGGINWEEIGRSRSSRPPSLAEIFIGFTGQSTAAAIALHFLGLSSGSRGLLVSVMVANLLGFVSCTAALWQSQRSASASRNLGRIGSAATSLGFILLIAMVVPPYLHWMIVLACLVLLAVFILSFIIYTTCK